MTNTALNSNLHKKINLLDWRKISKTKNIPLSKERYNSLIDLIENIETDEINNIYLPLSNILDGHIKCSREPINNPDNPSKNKFHAPAFIVGVAGSVAVSYTHLTLPTKRIV